MALMRARLATSGWMAAIAAAVYLVGVRPAMAEPGAAQRIVSVNLCTDQLLVDLVPTSRIAAVTALATDPLSTPAPERASGLGVTDGTVESILAFDPDLVLVTPFTPQATVALLKRLGRRVAVIPLAMDFAGIRTAIRALAAATGDISAGEALVQRFNGDLDRAAARARNAPERGSRALVYQVNSYVSGATGIVDEALRHAGYRNHAAALGFAGGGQTPLEAIVASPPDLLVLASGPNDYATTVADNLRHPVLKHIGRGMTTVVVPWSLWLCGTHHITRAVDLLVDARAGVVQRVTP